MDSNGSLVHSFDKLDGLWGSRRVNGAFFSSLLENQAANTG